MNIDVLRVFCDQAGSHGNPLGVVLDSAGIDHDQAQALAAELGFAETIFLDDPEAGGLRIYTPATRLPFAGHPTVGAAWYLHRGGHRVEALSTDAGLVPVEANLSGATVVASPEICPNWTFIELDSPAAVEAAEAGDQPRHDYLWSWIDESAGLIRARCFATDLGVAEDEATGSAAIRLADHLGRRIEVVQGGGSVLAAEPAGRDVRLSGAVVLDQELTDDARHRVAG